MIRNDRQLEVSRRKVADLLEAARQVSGADRDAYLEAAAEIEQEIVEYEAIRDGDLKVFQISSIDDLSDALVKARLARRLTQREVSEELGVSEQMVQRDEAGSYERASLARLAEVADVLHYQLDGELRPRELVLTSFNVQGGSEFRERGSVWVALNDLFSAAVFNCPLHGRFEMTPLLSNLQEPDVMGDNASELELCPGPMSSWENAKT